MSGVWEAGRDCRYSGARRGIGSIRGHLGDPRDVGGVGELLWGCQWGIRGCRGCQGCIVAGKDCRYSGARRGIEGIMGYWGLLGVIGVLGAVKGHQGVLGWQVDWKPDHIGPQSRVPALPLVSLGE